MARTATSKSESLDRFMQAMARVFGIPRKKLEKVMFPGMQRPVRSRRATAYRKRSKLAAR